jgi:hypothetical protein
MTDPQTPGQKLGISRVPGNVAANVPYWINRVIDEISAVVSQLTSDTGWLDFNTGGTPSTTDGSRYRRKGGIVYIQMNLLPQQFPDEQLLSTLPAGFRPKYLQLAQSRYQTVNSEIAIQPTGAIRCTEPVNAGIAFTVSFPVD